MFQRKKRNPSRKHKKPAPASKASGAPPSKSLILSLESRLMFDAAAAATASDVASAQVAQEQAEAAVSGDASHEVTGEERARGDDVVHALATYLPGEYLDLNLGGSTVSNNLETVDVQPGSTEPPLVVGESDQMNWTGILGGDYFGEGSDATSPDTELDRYGYVGDEPTAVGEDLLPALTSDMPAEQPVAVAFVDPTVPNYQELLSSMDP
ncbi:MAG TPA: hypothetical protein PLO50_10160, partial [Nitrospira sp.]|nr:hypothetical protein [Nitrospira sp.]